MPGEDRNLYGDSDGNPHDSFHSLCNDRCMPMEDKNYYGNLHGDHDHDGAMVFYSHGHLDQYSRYLHDADGIFVFNRDGLLHGNRLHHGY